MFWFNGSIPNVKSTLRHWRFEKTQKSIKFRRKIAKKSVFDSVEVGLFLDDKLCMFVYKKRKRQISNTPHKTCSSFLNQKSNMFLFSYIIHFISCLQINIHAVLTLRPFLLLNSFHRVLNLI